MIQKVDMNANHSMCDALHHPQLVANTPTNGDNVQQFLFRRFLQTAASRPTQLFCLPAWMQMHRRSLVGASSSSPVSILVVAEHARGSVAPATLAALRAAQQIATASNGEPETPKQSTNIQILVFDREGSDLTGVRDQLSNVKGVTKLVVVREKRCRHSLAETLAPVIARWSVDQGYTHVLAGGSTFGKNVLPRAAGILGVQPLSDITEVCSPWEFVRPMYAGSILARVRFVPTPETSAVAGRFCMATVRGTAFGVAEQSDHGDGPAEHDITTIASQFLDESSPPTVEWLGETSATMERPRLESARIVVTGGRGVQSASHFEQLVVALADKLGAAVGATRAAVDAGMCANELQVGQTGKIVAPELYIAVGVSGAIQHLAGMKDSKVVVAINKDPEAPIFQAADFGMVGDLFEIIPSLLERLERPRSNS
jgi:electron transfer flavoprotein alpha subunit